MHNKSVPARVTQDNNYLDEVLIVKSSIYEKEMSILKFIGNQDP